jgi:hypothetical protein
MRSFTLALTLTSAFVFSLLIGCNPPGNPNNPDNSKATLMLKSNDGSVNESHISDTLGNTVTIYAQYNFPEYFKYLTIQVYSDSAYTNKLVPETTFTKVNFSSKEIFDEDTFQIQLKKIGNWHVLLECGITNQTIFYDTVTISIYPDKNSKPVNQAPKVENITDTVSEDSTVALVLRGFDDQTDSSKLIYSITKNAHHGALEQVSQKKFNYIPEKDFNGVDSFYYAVSDSLLTSNNGVVNITVTSVNDKPIATDKSLPTALNTPITVLLEGSDVDDSIVNVFITKMSSHGSLDTSKVPAVIYTPQSNFKGNDTIQFAVVNKNSDTSAPGYIIINVASGNQKPSAGSLNILILEDMDTVIALAGSDIEKPAKELIYSIVKQSLNGKSSLGSDGKVTYSPAENFFGADSFYYKVNDGTIDSDSGKVVITISSVNDKPVVLSRALSTTFNTSLTIQMSATDDVDQNLNFFITKEPSHGTLDNSGKPTLVYTPANDFKGIDTIKYIAVGNQKDSSSEGTISINVGSENQKPVVANLNVSILEDNDTVFALVGTDIETAQKDLVYSIIKQSINGKAVIGSDGKVTYSPADDYFGADSFFYKVNDGTVDSDLGKVLIEISSVNDKPAVMGSALSTALNTLLIIQLRATDVDDQTLNYFITKDPGHGTLNSAGNPSLLYTPATGFKGIDTIRYIAVDNKKDSSSEGMFTIDVASDNQKPVAANLNFIIAEDNDPVITLVGTDIETPVQSLKYSIIAPPVHGRLSVLSGNGVTYTADADYFGADVFYYKVNDGTVDSDSGKVTITITAVNDAPVAEGDFYQAIEDQSFAVAVVNGVLVNDRDPETDPMTAVIAEQMPSNQGTVVLNSNGSFIYTPAANFIGAASFSYQTKDHSGALSAKTAVTIIVKNTNDRPVFIGTTEKVIVNEGASASRQITSTDVDGTTPRLRITDTNLPGWIVTSNAADNKIDITTTPTNSVVVGKVQQSTIVHFTATDDSLQVLDSVEIVVRNVNLKPQLTFVSPRLIDTVLTGASFKIRVNATDEDGNITKVLFYQDGLSIGQITTTTDSLAVSPLTFGIHRFKASAIDNDNDTISVESVVKVAQWKKFQGYTSNASNFAFDRNGDLVSAVYQQYSKTIIIQRFDPTNNGSWVKISEKSLSVPEYKDSLNIFCRSISFLPNNNPVVLLDKNISDSPYSSYTINHVLTACTLNTSQSWTKICDTIFRQTSGETSSAVQIATSLSGITTMCWYTERRGAPNYGEIFIQNGSSWNINKQLNSAAGINLSYYMSTLYVTASSPYSNSYMYKLDGLSLTPVGINSGYIGGSGELLRPASFTSDGTPYVSGHLWNNIIYTFNSGTWQRVWPKDNRNIDSTSTDFNIHIVNNQIYAAILKNNYSTSTDSIFIKRLNGINMNGVFSSDGLISTYSSSGSTGGGTDLMYSFVNNKRHLITWKNTMTGITEKQSSIIWSDIPE